MESRSKQVTSRAYLLQRAAEERHAASRATCGEARIAHRQLASRYAAEADADASEPDSA